MSEFVENSAPASATPEVTSAPTTPSAPSSPATPTTPAVVSTQPPATPSGGEAQVPSYRLRQQREQYEQRIAQMTQAQNEANARFEQVQRQLQSLVGVTPPANPEVETIKQQFSQLFPGLSKMEQRAAEIEALIARSGDLESQTQHYWQTHGRSTLDRLFSKASETYGGNLSDAAKQQLHSYFVGYVQSSPENQERYASDPSIVDDFWKAFSSNLIDPVRRSAAAVAQDRVPGGIPQDTPSGAPRATPAPQPASLDERVNLAWTQYNKFGQK